jgi:hypothetical protein
MATKKQLTPEEIDNIVETEVRHFNIMVWTWHDNMIEDLMTRLNLPKDEVEELVNTAINAKVSG